MAAVWLAASASAAHAADDGVSTEGVVAERSTTSVGGTPVGGTPVAGTEVASPVATSVVDPEKPVRLAPVVHCTWVLPDMDLDPANGQQYEAAGLSDDLPDQLSPTPCDLGAGSSPAQADAMVGMAGSAQVLPNGGDLPGVRRVEVWTAVSHAAGPTLIGTVVVTVRAPDGTVVQPSSTDTVVGPSSPGCEVLSDVLAAAVRSGQMSQAAATSEWGMSGLCSQGWIAMVRQVIPVSSGDACGTYDVEVAASSEGQRTTRHSAFDVLCFHELVTDFTSVDWKDLVPGALSVAPGDVDPTTADKPTVENRGNAPMALAVTFRPLCLVGSDPPVCIGDFGLELAVDGAGAVVRHEPSPPGQELVADEDDPAGMLCPGEKARLDLLVATPEQVVPGRYSGSMQLFGIRSSGSCPRASTPPTTVAPTTVAPTTVAPTTVAPTTVAPTTVAPTTVAPTTVAPRRTATTPSP